MPITGGLIAGGGALLGGIGNIFGGSSSAKAAKQAAQMQLQAAREAQAYNREMLGRTEQGLGTYAQMGESAAPYYQYLASGGKFGEEFNVEDTPAYAYQQKKMEDAINAAYAARGMSGGRAAVNSLVEGSQGLAASEFDKALGRLGGLVDTGFNTQMGLGNLRAGSSAQNASTLANMASGYGAAKQNYGSAVGGMWGAGGQALGSLGSSYAQGLAAKPAYDWQQNLNTLLAQSQGAY